MYEQEKMLEYGRRNAELERRNVALETRLSARTTAASKKVPPPSKKEREETSVSTPVATIVILGDSYFIYFITTLTLI
jgi:hypothetical protein